MLSRGGADFNTETSYLPTFSVCAALRGQQLKRLGELHHLKDLKREEITKAHGNAARRYTVLFTAKDQGRQKGQTCTRTNAMVGEVFRSFA